MHKKRERDLGVEEKDRESTMCYILMPYYCLFQNHWSHWDFSEVFVHVNSA